jgi:hypothetical protein
VYFSGIVSVDLRCLGQEQLDYSLSHLSAQAVRLFYYSYQYKKAAEPTHDLTLTVPLNLS